MPRERLGEELPVQRDRALVDAAGGREQHAQRGLRLLLEEATERRRRRHGLGEAVRDLEDRVDAARA